MTTKKPPPDRQLFALASIMVLIALSSDVVTRPSLIFPFLLRRILRSGLAMATLPACSAYRNPFDLHRMPHRLILAAAFLSFVPSA